MKIDYSEEIRDFLKNNFEPVESVMHADEETLQYSLSNVHIMIERILPHKWVEESDVYEALQELGFKSFIFVTEAEEIYDEEKDMEITIPGRRVLAYFLQPIN